MMALVKFLISALKGIISTLKDWIMNVVWPIGRVALAMYIAWLYVTSLSSDISKGANEATKSMITQWSTVISPELASKYIPSFYLIHLALPTMAVFVALFSVVGNGKNNLESSSNPLRGFGWVLIALVIGLISTFFFPLIEPKKGFW